MSKIQGWLGLAKKAGLLETGEENTGNIVRNGGAVLVILASDASDNAKRRAEGFVYGRNTPLVRIPLTKDDISFATGRNGCSMAVFKDLGFAANFLKSLAAEREGFSEISNEFSEKHERALLRLREKKKHKSTNKLGKRRKKV